MATGPNGIAVFGDIVEQLMSGAIAKDATKCVTRDEATYGYLIAIPSSYANNQCVKYSDIKNVNGGVSFITTDNSSGNIDFEQLVYSPSSLNITSITEWYTHVSNNPANCTLSSVGPGNFQIFKHPGYNWSAGYYYFVVWGTTYGNHLYEFYLSSTQANTLNTQKVMLSPFESARKNVLS